MVLDASWARRLLACPAVARSDNGQMARAGACLEVRGAPAPADAGAPPLLGAHGSDWCRPAAMLRSNARVARGAGARPAAARQAAGWGRAEGRTERGVLPARRASLGLGAPGEEAALRAGLQGRVGLRAARPARQAGLGLAAPGEKAALRDFRARTSSRLLPHRDPNGFRRLIVLLSEAGAPPRRRPCMAALCDGLA